MAMKKKAVAPKKTGRVNERTEGLKTKKALQDYYAKQAAKKPSAMGQSAKAHQKDLAKISGKVAVINEEKRQIAQLKKTPMGAKISWNGNKIVAAGPKAIKKTAASFKKSK